MPFIIKKRESTEDEISFTEDLQALALSRLNDYQKNKNIKALIIKKEMIAYASPDSTYAVTKKLLDAAKDEIVIGIYDFSAGYMKEVLLNAKRRGVQVSVMIDVKKSEHEEEKIFAELEKFGCETVHAPSAFNSNANARYFSNYHAKVIVIDNSLTLIQSGNYSNNSIPLNEKDGGDASAFVTGNRDMGVAIYSDELAAFFRGVLLSDINLVRNAEQPEELMNETLFEEQELVEAVPKQIPSKLFASAAFELNTSVKVIPVLTPDNYMDVIPGFLQSAKKSIFIEQQYIHSSQAQITVLLQAMLKAKERNSELEIKIILGKVFGKSDYDKEVVNIANLKSQFGLLLADNIRYININRFVHCHNKLIIIDDEAVLISSQNWSDTAVTLNREAGVIIEYPDISKYYSEIFKSDWSTALTNIPLPSKNSATPEEVAAGNYVGVSFSDYARV